MKYTLLLLMVVCSFFNGHAQNAELGVGAIGLVVSDLAKSEKFYVDILGFKANGGFELPKEWSEEAGMANGSSFAVKVFRLQEKETATMLKLAYFRDQVAKGELSGIGEKSGVNYLTFYYPSLEAVKERIMQAGLPVVGELERERYKLLIIRDPDGVFVELIELK